MRWQVPRKPPLVVFCVRLPADDLLEDPVVLRFCLLEVVFEGALDRGRNVHLVLSTASVAGTEGRLPQTRRGNADMNLLLKTEVYRTRRLIGRKAKCLHQNLLFNPCPVYKINYPTRRIIAKSP